MKHDTAPGFHPEIRDGSIFPIHILGAKIGDVALGAAQMPEHFIIRVIFRIVLLGEDALMLGPSDCALGVELNFRPLPFGNDRFGNPIHVEGKIVNAPQKYIGRNRPLVKRFKEMFRLCFDQGQITERVKRRVLDGRVPAFPSVAGFRLGHPVHHKPPGAFGVIRVAVLQINPSDLQIDRGLIAGFIEGVQEALRFLRPGRVQAFSFLGEVVEGIINAVFTSENMVA